MVFCFVFLEKSSDDILTNNYCSKRLVNTDFYGVCDSLNSRIYIVKRENVFK